MTMNMVDFKHPVIIGLLILENYGLDKHAIRAEQDTIFASVSGDSVITEHDQTVLRDNGWYPIGVNGDINEEALVLSPDPSAPTKWYCFV